MHDPQGESGRCQRARDDDQVQVRRLRAVHDDERGADGQQTSDQGLVRTKQQVHENDDAGQEQQRRSAVDFEGCNEQAHDQHRHANAHALAGPTTQHDPGGQPEQ